jgi:hypothetical protein
LWLREGPGQYACNKLQVYAAGTQVTVLGKESRALWLQVETANGKVGWMSTNFLELNVDVEDIPISPKPEPCCAPIEGPFAGTWPSVQEGLGCPLNGALTGLAREQRFEGGSMLWFDQRPENVFVRFADGTGQSVAYVPLGKGDPPFACPDEATPSECPPTPRDEFGAAWCADPALRARLGNAVDCGREYTGSMQAFERGHMLQTDSGDVYVFYADGSWLRIEIAG